MSMIDDIKRDREAGTPGPWLHGGFSGVHAYGICDTMDCSVLGRIATAEITDRTDRDGRHWSTSGNSETNARRIARLPDLEAKYIALKEAADELAESMSHERNMVCQDIGMQLDASSRVDAALARYREASQ